MLSMRMMCVMALLPVCTQAFLTPVMPKTLRGARGISMSVVSNSEEEAALLSRRSFFKQSGAAALTVGALGMEVPQSAFAESLPPVNAPAPEFNLPSNRGKNIGLNDLKGKWAVLYFYPGDFTSGCTIEAQNFEKESSNIRGLGAEIYGVSVDSADKHLDFAKAYNLSFPLLSDQGGAVSALYGSVLKIPFFGTFSNRQTYLIDPEGKLRWVFTDVESRLAKHAKEVAAKLKELQSA